MLAYSFTKTLQVQIYNKLREVIIGWEHIETLKEIKSYPSKEHIGHKYLEKTIKTEW